MGGQAEVCAVWGAVCEWRGRRRMAGEDGGWMSVN